MHEKEKARRARLDELCGRIVEEQDPQKFSKLVNELNELLSEKEEDLERHRPQGQKLQDQDIPRNKAESN